MANRYPNLHPTTSLLDLQNDWIETPRPASSSSVSTSSTSRSVTPTQTLQSPQSPWSSPISPQAVRSPQPTHPSNPWHAHTYSNSKRSSPTGSPESQTPKYTSRSTTPVPAPQPIRPGNAVAGLNQSSYNVNVIDNPPKVIEYPTSPPPSQSRYVPYHPDLQALERTLITRDIACSYRQWYPSMLVRLGISSESKNNAYHWACRNPLVALLFLLCEDVAAFPRAYFYSLSDGNLPFHEEDLEYIASNPRRVIDTQWRVMLKQLSKNGEHALYQRHERPPFQRQSVVDRSKSPHEVVDRVFWLGDPEGNVYMRKTYAAAKEQEQKTLLDQIKNFKRFEHANVAKIIGSYSEMSSLSFITSAAQSNLDDYMKFGENDSTTRSTQLINWINDLTQALAFIHSQPRKPTHKNICPQKILVDGSRIYFAAFGIHSDLNTSFVIPQYTDSNYIYTAPEVIWNGQRHIPLTRASERLADVFSLGCVLFSMLNVSKGYKLERHHARLRQESHKGETFIKRLTTCHNKMLYVYHKKASSSSPEVQALKFIEWMLKEEPNQRTKMRELAPYVREWDERRRLSKRRSLDDLDGESERRNLTTRMANVQINPISWNFEKHHAVKRAFTTS